jgi:hypothetical protein
VTEHRYLPPDTSHWRMEGNTLVCKACGEPMPAHDRDDIGAGLIQYSCPQPKDTP